MKPCAKFQFRVLNIASVWQIEQNYCCCQKRHYIATSKKVVKQGRRRQFCSRKIRERELQRSGRTGYISKGGVSKMTAAGAVPRARNYGNCSDSAVGRGRTRSNEPLSLPSVTCRQASDMRVSSAHRNNFRLRFRSGMKATEAVRAGAQCNSGFRSNGVTHVL